MAIPVALVLAFAGARKTNPWGLVGVLVWVAAGTVLFAACSVNPLAHPYCCALLPSPGTPDHVDAGP